MSVVIPTFNRGAKLKQTVDHVLACRTDSLNAVEIIIVDDGSAQPARQYLDSLEVPSPFSLLLVRQENTGPGGARNRGFSVSRGDLVLFMDDDVLATPTLLSQHIQAQRSNPGSVICGVCHPFAPDEQPFLKALTDSLHSGSEPPTGANETFIPVPVVASGQLSVDRKSFSRSGRVYASNLRTPAAEEYELTYRVRQRGIPILFAPHIVGIHDSEANLEALCVQQQKHGKGCAEVASKYPATLTIDGLSDVIRQNGPLAWRDPIRVSFRKVLKGFLAIRLARTAILRILERLGPILGANPLFLRATHLLIGLYFFAGVREGLRIYPNADLPEQE